MDILANDLSIHGQFHDIGSFRKAFRCLMKMRAAARSAGYEIQWHRALAGDALPGVPMLQALQQLHVNERRSAMSWLNRVGPFWDDLRRHGRDDYLECRGRVVTDAAVGEAAFRKLHGMECALASVTPSDWDFSPIDVTWVRDEDIVDRRASLKNWRDPEAMMSELAPAGVASWRDLELASTDRFNRLTFADDCFKPLTGIPFARCSADRVLALLGILNRLALSFDGDGIRTGDGHYLYDVHFKGDNASFSDSSPTDKATFRRELTFPHPAGNGEKLFCPWHGKESRSVLRLHFSWPIRFREPVYVVYVGPKLTKR